MDHNYEEIVQDEQIQIGRDYQFNSQAQCPNLILLLITSICVISSGFIFIWIGQNSNEPSFCHPYGIILKYYSQYLILDGVVQLITCFLLFCMIIFSRTQQLDKKMQQQLLFQTIDIMVLIVIVTTFMLIIKNKKSCFSISTQMFLPFYLFLMYILGVILLVKQIG